METKASLSSTPQLYPFLFFRVNEHSSEVKVMYLSSNVAAKGAIPIHRFEGVLNLPTIRRSDAENYAQLSEVKNCSEWTVIVSECYTLPRFAAAPETPRNGRIHRRWNHYLSCGMRVPGCNNGGWDEKMRRIERGECSPRCLPRFASPIGSRGVAGAFFADGGSWRAFLISCMRVPLLCGNKASLRIGPLVSVRRSRVSATRACAPSASQARTRVSPFFCLVLLARFSGFFFRLFLRGLF